MMVLGGEDGDRWLGHAIIMGVYGGLSFNM